ncbi:L-glutamine synthetase [Bartonella sp. CDC_skunk]|uniref:glutamine synthetase family protein n=1 Tax=unclassified Bartonella TaxID=2645622 RepID=UPI00099B0594|nr:MULTISPECIES: glutamine synthetase family protein [unclassified Bartonella]AQX20877.1 L-glutamine synthetase [Bartonella sp. CDC_skunk]AQX26133.1 L-glutamine synthetase [Bartonella sp. Raccoon60]
MKNENCKSISDFLENLRGVKDWKQVSQWLAFRNVEDIECITPDQAGVARGKMMLSKKFTSDTSLALPSSVFMSTISGNYPEDSNGFEYPKADGDLRLEPDLSTLTIVPWEEAPTAQVICDLIYQNGQAVEYTPRNVLRTVIDFYTRMGLKPVVAPEIEFYFVQKNPDPDYPLVFPVGRSGRAIGGGQGYSIAGVNEFDEVIDDIYHFSEAQGLEIDTLIHEEGAGQFEINLRHGDPIELADQVFMFKRTIREAALKHNMYATFMAKPIQGQPGSAMHIHQSVINQETGANLFTKEDGGESVYFRYFIGGLQRHMAGALVMLAPYVNSYRRLMPGISAPVNLRWGYDNRTTAFRVPSSVPQGRRVENRIPSSDANPYLALAASLACGLIGLQQKIEPDNPTIKTVNADNIELPRGLIEAVNLFEQDKELRAILGDTFVSTYAAIKRQEFEIFMEVISPWEREYLLLNV